MRLSEMRRLVKEDMERWALQNAERLARYRHELEEKQKQQHESELQRRKRHWQLQFEQWVKNNERARWEVGAEVRAETRRRQDQTMVDQLIYRIEQKQRLRHEALNFAPAKLSDHEYISWKFACLARTSKRWMSYCVEL
jgi:isopenicillin N synthase-like dioxygenase